MTRTDTFTSVGILLNLNGTQAESAAVIDSSVNAESLQAWAMAFLERWSSSSALAARYLRLLRRSEEQLRKHKKTKSGTGNSGNDATGRSTPYEPYDALPSFPDPSDTFQWMPDTGALEMDAWGFDTHFGNMGCSASGPVL